MILRPFDVADDHAAVGGVGAVRPPSQPFRVDQHVGVFAARVRLQFDVARPPAGRCLTAQVSVERQEGLLVNEVVVPVAEAQRSGR